MKKLVLFTALILPLILTAQTNYISVEAQYLRTINSQGNKDLIKDDLRNAELVTDSIIFKHLNDKAGDNVMANLAYSYFLVRNYPMGYIASVRYFLFYPNLEQKQMVLQIMYKCAQKSKLNVDPQQIISQINDLKTFNSKLQYLLRQAIDIDKRQVVPFVQNLVYQMQAHGEPVPFWAEQWLFFVNLGFSPSKARKMTDFSQIKTPATYTNFIKNLSGFNRFQVSLRMLCHKF